MPIKIIIASIWLLSAAGLTGCTVVKVVDAAASTAVGVVKTTAKAGVAVVDAAIPDGDEEDESDAEEKVADEEKIVEKETD